MYSKPSHIRSTASSSCKHNVLLKQCKIFDSTCLIERKLMAESFLQIITYIIYSLFLKCAILENSCWKSLAGTHPRNPEADETFVPL